MIDLVVRRVSVGLGAPQSIHRIETITCSDNVYLLVVVTCRLILLFIDAMIMILSREY